jgi:hypothetical protein
VRSRIATPASRKRYRSGNGGPRVGMRSRAIVLNESPSMPGPRFEQALVYANRRHASQKRKSTKIMTRLNLSGPGGQALE